ncbi:nucleotidyltransferase domain-containing protein [Tissierella sp. Yu-01]|uniref:nucleotidyltransferase family protein n=1 Tax=Tissierella sp. Yu-01 TaxID=3035694 RepID=UPI00240CE86F|nr:nucleotidyltransferase domain-containing protein [Tissierella sp. Yu-01]WFA08243.1 nucleotidyltransferase domain-containing protein [Tissierella sp. Yu-01]
MIINEINNLRSQIIDKFNPLDIYLFGSHAKGISKKNSDVDICVIINTDNKRQLLQRMLYELDYKFDLDIVIYTEDEWHKYCNDTSTFASIINRTGVSLIGGYN